MFGERDYARPFLTGSRAYGPYDPDADTDVVLLVDEKLLTALKAVCKRWRQLDNRGTLVQFERLDLICCVTETQFILWKKGTDVLTVESPVQPGQAREMFAELFGPLSMFREPTDVSDLE